MLVFQSMKQQSLFPLKNHSFHGGMLAKGRRKERRPFAKNRPVHLVLKSKKNLSTNRKLVESKIQHLSGRFSIRVYDLAVSQDHVHLSLKIPRRNEYVNFLRALTGVLARLLGSKLWKLPPSTRVISWGRDFQYLKKYFRENREESGGLRPYRKRGLVWEIFVRIEIN